MAQDHVAVVYQDIINEATQKDIKVVQMYENGSLRRQTGDYVIFMIVQKMLLYVSHIQARQDVQHFRDRDFFVSPFEKMFGVRIDANSSDISGVFTIVDNEKSRKVVSGRIIRNPKKDLMR